MNTRELIWSEIEFDHVHALFNGIGFAQGVEEGILYEARRILFMEGKAR